MRLGRHTGVRFASFCLFLLGCAPAVQPAAEPAPASAPTVVVEEISFRRGGPAVGEITEEVEERRLVITLSDGDRVEKVERVEERHTVLRVLAVEDGLAVKAHVAYQRHRLEPAGEVLVEGRAFIIERTDAALAVRDVSGEPMEAAVHAFVAKDFARFGTRTGLYALPKSSLKVGQRALSFERAMRRELARRAPGELKDLKVRLQEIRDTSGGRAGVFVATFVAVDSQRDMTMHLRAEIVIRSVDGAILSSLITGPMAMGGAVRGEGTVRMVSEYTYR